MGWRMSLDDDGVKWPRWWLQTMLGLWLGVVVSCDGTTGSGSGGSAGAGASSGSGGDGGTFPEGCEFLARTVPPPECSGEYSSAAQCEQIKTEDRERDYTLEVDPLGSAAEREERVECLLSWLDALGLEGEADPLGEQIEVVAKYPEIELVLESAALKSYWVECENPRCEYCELLNEQDCAEDAFCRAYEGWRLDDAENQECLDPEARRFASCMSAQEGCGQAQSHARDGSGDCWYFWETCYDQTLLPVDESCGGDTASVPSCDEL